MTLCSSKNEQNPKHLASLVLARAVALAQQGYLVTVCGNTDGAFTFGRVCQFITKLSELQGPKLTQFTIKGILA